MVYYVRPISVSFSKYVHSFGTTWFWICIITTVKYLLTHPVHVCVMATGDWRLTTTVLVWYHQDAIAIVQLSLWCSMKGRLYISPSFLVATANLSTLDNRQFHDSTPIIETSDKICTLSGPWETCHFILSCFLVDFYTFCNFRNRNENITTTCTVFTYLLNWWRHSCVKSHATKVLAYFEVDSWN